MSSTAPTDATAALAQGLTRALARIGLPPPQGLERLSGGANMESWRFVAGAETCVLRRAPGGDKLVGGRAIGLDTEAAMDRILPVAARLSLADELDNYAEDFSRGMKKKLGLLLAMLHQPRLLVLDEPTNGLDVESTHLFYDLIEEVAAGGTTVLFSTHLMDHVTRLCSHALIIKKGELIAQGPLAELKLAHGEDSLEALFLKLTGSPQIA